MTLAEFSKYYEQTIKARNDELKVHERFSARICCLIANANRDTKKKRKPFTEDDFIASDTKKDKMTNDQFVTVLKALTLSHGGEIT